MKSRGSYAGRQIVIGLGCIAGLSAALLLGRVLAAGNVHFWFLIWNLTLAAAPLLAAYGLRYWLRRGRWLSWQAICLTLLWLGFLPNSFYLVTDFIHLSRTGDVGVLYDVVMLSSFAFSGVILGFTAMYIVQIELFRRLARSNVWAITLGVFLLSSFAIYLGRFLAWNSWDVVINPAGIVFDVSDRLINPAQHPNTFTTTMMFFVFLSLLYVGLYKLIRGLSTLTD